MTKASPPLGGYELLALTLLCCTPSDLNQMWQYSISPDDAAQLPILNQLGFSDVTKQRASGFLHDHWQSRAIFSGMGQLHMAFYGGSGPHPNLAQAQAIIAALKSLDGGKL